MNGRPAVLLDRDGTLTEPRHYPSSPAELVLQPGIGAPLRGLRELGVALVVVTNQSGLARGLFTPQDLDAMHRHLRSRLRALGVRLDGIYHCPHHPDGTVPELAVRCRCRKPGPGLLLRAAEDLHLDLARSWMVGDFASDVGAGRRAGCRTALVGPAAADPAPDSPAPDLRAPTTARALELIAGAFGGTP
ncbi:D-glycero-alpha-D-manno-heptose-1,7-bisphosphate 7-phosphatase [Kitasatospora cineracea]|uniref:D-glycero-alpha-D-manno-heptose-1,7-bisphosphate 7-phosphatase n=1 Tax=Kitasatospora cineracea TaxID=88074 RepID=UPI0036DD9B9B